MFEMILMWLFRFSSFLNEMQSGILIGLFFGWRWQLFFVFIYCLELFMLSELVVSVCGRGCEWVLEKLVISSYIDLVEEYFEDEYIRVFVIDLGSYELNLGFFGSMFCVVIFGVIVLGTRNEDVGII